VLVFYTLRPCLHEGRVSPALGPSLLFSFRLGHQKHRVSPSARVTLSSCKQGLTLAAGILPLTLLLTLQISMNAHPLPIVTSMRYVQTLKVLTNVPAKMDSQAMEEPVQVECHYVLVLYFFLLDIIIA
jgi:hypothetical protein